MRRLTAFLAVGSLLGCSQKHVEAPRPPGPTRARLIERSVLAAQTFTAGPKSGARLEQRFGVPFPSQPVQGFSSLQLEPGGYVSVSDNGYGVPETSGDFLLRASSLRTRDQRLTAETAFIISDPSKHLPWPIRNAFTAERMLTGADLDPESMVQAPDGTFWIGDEHGPFLVHLDAQGRILEPPFSPEFEGGLLLGPDNPFLRPNLFLRSMEALMAHASAHGARAPIASPEHRWLTSKAQIDQLHTAGIQVIPWTVNEPTRLDELLEWGIDGVISDRPDLARGFVDAGKQLQGHRGARGLAPENTLAAFFAGLDAGSTVLELDLTGTADDEALVWHDVRLAAPKCPSAPDGGLPIPATRVTALQQLTCDGLLPTYPLQKRLPGSYRPMTLTEALRLPGALNIETKVHGSGLPHDDAVWLTRLLIKRVAEADAGARVTLQSFDWRALELAHREAPWLQTVALFGTSDTAGVSADRRAGLPWPERSTPPSVTRSAGFENLALSADGRSLIAMLEKPLPGSRECLALRFDLTTKAWTGVAFRFPMDPHATAVGDLTIAGSFAYALERDDSERRADGFKRLVRFALPAVEGAVVQKHTAADLLDLALPDGGTFTFPFWTIEGAVVQADGGVAIINDNNFPFGRGRSESEPDETELIVIEPIW